MMIENLDIAPPASRPARKPTVRSRKEIIAVTDTAPEISRETVLMLAVRDRRDRAAFAELFDHFAPRLKGFIMRSGTGSGQAEEIVQEVMLTVWHKADQFDPARAQVSAWIYQIARNRQIDVLRKENRPLPEELAEDPGAEPDASPGAGAGAGGGTVERGAGPVETRAARDHRAGLYGRADPSGDQRPHQACRWEPSSRASGWGWNGCDMI